MRLAPSSAFSPDRSVVARDTRSPGGMFMAPTRGSWASGYRSWLLSARRGTRTSVSSSPDKLLIFLTPNRARVVDVADVYYLEAVGEFTLVRTRAARRLRDVRRMGEVLEAVGEKAFLRIHRNHAVNPDRIREIRRRTPGGDWEVKLEPPVNRGLPVSRKASKRLWAALTARR